MTSRKSPDQILRHSTRFRAAHSGYGCAGSKLLWNIFHGFLCRTGSCQKSGFSFKSQMIFQNTHHTNFIYISCIIYTCIHRHTEKFELKTKDIWGLICRQFDGFTQEFGIFSLAHPWSSSMSRIAHVRPNKTGFFIGICYVYYHA